MCSKAFQQAYFACKHFVMLIVVVDNNKFDIIWYIAISEWFYTLSDRFLMGKRTIAFADLSNYSSL